MRSLILFLPVFSSAAHALGVHRILHGRQDELEIATYDDACNIGYCSVMGATIGGWGANYTTVETLDELASAVSSPLAAVVILKGAISGNQRVSIGSGKTIVGTPGSSLIGVGLHLNQSRNVILRNLKVSQVSPAQGDAISIENSRSIWLDHCDLSFTHSPVYDGHTSLLSITRGSDLVTVTSTVFRNHPQAVLVGHSDANGGEDQGKLHATFARNYFRNVGSAISFRFATGHILNSYFENATDGINTRMGARVMVESSVLEVSGRAVFSDGSTEAGYATVQDVLLGNSSNTAPPANLTVDTLPYPYDWYIWDKDWVRGAVTRQAGPTLQFLPATSK